MRKNKAKISIIILLVLAVASFFVLLKSIGPEKIVKTLFEIDVWKLALVVLAYIINLGFFAWRWKRVLKTQDLDINYFSLTEYRFAGFSISYLTPASNFGGEPVMAYLLKEKEGVDFPQALSSIIINRLIELLSKVSFITISILYALFFLILPSKITILFYIFAALVVILLLPTYFFILKNKKPFHRLINFTGLNNMPLLKQTQKVKEFDEKIHNFFHNETKEFFANLSIAIISNLFLVISIWAAIYSLNINLTFLEAIAAWSVNAIAAFIPVPAKIGVGEASQSGWFSVMKLGAASGFSLYLIIRARDILIAGTGLGVLFLKFKKVWRDSLHKVKKQYKSPK